MLLYKYSFFITFLSDDKKNPQDLYSTHITLQFITGRSHTLLTFIVGTSFASRKKQDFSRKILGSRHAIQKFTKNQLFNEKAKKKNFHVVMKTFIQKNLLKTYIQPKKMDFFQSCKSRKKFGILSCVSQDIENGRNRPLYSHCMHF